MGTGCAATLDVTIYNIDIAVSTRAVTISVVIIIIVIITDSIHMVIIAVVVDSNSQRSRRS